MITKTIDSKAAFRATQAFRIKTRPAGNGCPFPRAWNQMFFEKNGCCREMDTGEIYNCRGSYSSPLHYEMRTSGSCQVNHYDSIFYPGGKGVGTSFIRRQRLSRTQIDLPTMQGTVHCITVNNALR